MPQQRIGSTARTLSSTDTDRNPRQTGCLQLVASYDTQEDTLGLFYIPGPTGGSRLKVHDSYENIATQNDVLEEDGLASNDEMSILGKTDRDHSSLLKDETDLPNNNVNNISGGVFFLR